MHSVFRHRHARCGKPNPKAKDPARADLTATPEAAYRQLMVAMLMADEQTIRDVIVDRDDADVLWKGQYPKDVAALLAEQYRTMEISKKAGEDTEQVALHSSAFPLPLTVRKVGGYWKVDAGPIIEARHAAKALTPAAP